MYYILNNLVFYGVYFYNTTYKYNLRFKYNQVCNSQFLYQTIITSYRT